MTLSTRRALRARQLEREDRLVVPILELGSEDAEYVSVLKSLETDVYEFAPDKLKSISDYKTDLSIITLETGKRLTVRNGCEILVPKLLRAKMLSTLHFTHHGNKTMVKQVQGKIFWPRICDDLRMKYENCEE